MVALPLIDLTRVDVPNSSASNLSKCRHLVLGILKKPLWEDALTKTQTMGDTSLEVRGVGQAALGWWLCCVCMGVPLAGGLGWGGGEGRQLCCAHACV